MIEQCKNCGGIYATEHLETFAGTPCECGLRSSAVFCIFNADGTIDREMLDIAARAGHKESNDAEMEKALELSAAGWSPEIEKHHTPHPFTGNVDVMSWYWRRPARRKGQNGRRYLSTNQAWNALRRDMQNHELSDGSAARSNGPRSPETTN